MIGADTPVPQGGILTPVLASLLRCLRVSENSGVYRSQTSRPGHSWQARKKISSVAFLLARREGNSHPSTTGTPQLKATVKHAGDAPILPTLPPCLLFPISSSDLSTPPPPNSLSGIPEQKGHRCPTPRYYYRVEACVNADINLTERSTPGPSAVVVHHRSVRYGAFQELSWDKM